MKLIITGAGGYIGSVLTEEMIRNGHNVTAVDRYFFGEEKLKHLPPERLNLLRADIRELTPRNFENIDAVFDLAALSNDPSGDLDPELTQNINHKGRAHVARCAKQAGVARYILSSSCSIYGFGDGGTLDETTLPRPITAYAQANLNAEQDTLSLGNSSFTCAAIRNATVFGLSPRMRFDLVVNVMTLNAVQKSKIFVLGGGHQWRPLVHVRDVARAFGALLTAEPHKIAGEVFNLGISNYQVQSIAYTVRETLPFKIDIEIAPDDTDRRDYKVSFEKMRRVIGFQPTVSVQDGIFEIYEALKMGQVSPSPDTVTVSWYRTIIEAEALINRVKLNGRLL